MMDYNHAKSCNPAVARLKSEHSLLSTEINQLNRELLMLKDTIRYKQKDLRVINIALIHKATRGPFLSVIKSTSENSLSRQVKTRTKTELVCLQGGK